MQVQGLSNYDLSLSIYNCRGCSNNILWCTIRISCALVRIRILIRRIWTCTSASCVHCDAPTCSMALWVARAAGLHDVTPHSLLTSARRVAWLREWVAQTITFPVSDGAILLNIPVRRGGVIFTCFFNVCFFTCFLVVTWLLSCKGILYFQVLSLCVWCTASSAFWHHRSRG